jgi:putative hydrolases of HD superfamily
LLAFLRWEKEWVHYDISLLLRKILFSGFFTFIYSDISSDVKERLRHSSPEIYTELENTLYEMMHSWEMEAYIHDDIDATRTKTPEDDLIAFAKLWASYYEVYHNSLVYSDAYAKVMRHMMQRSEHEKYIPFLPYLDFDPHNQSTHERYLLVIHRLASSYRWNRSVRKYPVSVLSHTYLITFFTYLIARREGYDDTTLEDMLLTALYHDIPEAITGDIITPTKKAVPWLEYAIESIEHDMVEDYLLSYLDGYSFTGLLSRKMLHPWSEPHGNLVKQADILSAYHEARIEAPNSLEYQEVMKKLEGKINLI